MNRTPVKRRSNPFDPLAFPAVTLYLLGVKLNGLMTIRRLTFGVCAGTVLMTALAVFLFVYFYDGVVDEAFQERSAAYAAAFADAIDVWLGSGDKELVRKAARFLLVGSSIYVQVFLDGTLFIDERAQGAEKIELPPLVDSPVGRVLHYARLKNGPAYLDVAIPYIAFSTDGEKEGYIRIGIDASSIGIRTRNMALIAAGIGMFFDLFILGAFFLLLRKAPVPVEAGGTVFEYGPLRIDESERRVTLSGEPVSLPPKQYALLRLLAGGAGRVFSEKEILAAVWPESAYADSKDVKQCVYLLRRRLGKEAGKMIVNVPGFGYKLALSDDFETDLTDP